MEELFSSLQTQLGSTLPLVLGAFVVLLAGWIAALLVRAVLRKALTLLHVNRGIQSATGATLDIETWIVVGAFYLVLFFTLMAFFNVLRLEMVSGSLQALLSHR